MRQGSETSSAASIRVSTTAPCNVSCAAFRHAPIDFTTILIPSLGYPDGGLPSADVIVGNTAVPVRWRSKNVQAL